MENKQSTKRTATTIRINWSDGTHDDIEIDTATWEAGCRLAKKTGVTIDAFIEDAIRRLKDKIDGGLLKLPVA